MSLLIPDTNIEQIEIDLLLEAIFRCYGYDFRGYARASLERRLRLFLSSSGCSSISAMIPRLLNDEAFFTVMAQHFSIAVTELYRDPFVYRAIREKIVPLLRTWPHIKVWVAGCATGEEAYSLAILLKEEGLYDRVTLYATDFNDQAISTAAEGIYDIKHIQQASRNYQKAGGTASFSEYYQANYDSALIMPALKKRIVFSCHNLATDGVFGDMQLVLCRNVLIYFNRELQNRALKLMTDSLVSGGFLCLGTKEDLRFSQVYERYEVVDERAKIYKRCTERREP